MNKYEYIIQSDPTLKFFCRDAKIEWFTKLENHQFQVIKNSLSIAFSQYLNKKYE